MQLGLNPSFLFLFFLFVFKQEPVLSFRFSLLGKLEKQGLVLSLWNLLFRENNKHSSGRIQRMGWAAGKLFDCKGKSHDAGIVDW